MLAIISKIGSGAAKASLTVWSALWTFPSILLSAFIIAWGAEAAQFLMSQGLALAILAWLQTLPEFAVEAVIAWEAGKDISKTHLAIANFTGSLRLLVGLGWPMIYFVAWFFNRRNPETGNSIELVFDDEHSVEVWGLFLPILYFIFIWWKGSLTIWDSIPLMGSYFLYLFILWKIPPKKQDEETMDEVGRIPRAILRLERIPRLMAIWGLFLLGGLILYFSAHPFLESMLAIAVSLGVSQFVFVQWVAPFLSEFPEKVSAFYWARKVTSAPLALMNMVSSNINQWSILTAMIPIIFAVSSGGNRALVFDAHQKHEILLTIVQGLLGFLFLLNMRLSAHEAFGLFTMWLIQFVLPSTREMMIYLYLLWCAIEIIRLIAARKAVPAYAGLRRVLANRFQEVGA
ncbi:MAG TPA: hypothetical protein VHL58_06175 [Thermoanaerobaculia bacterium]|nr:hypothetical protein [Thermoanaerobaculia bacterium]